MEKLKDEKIETIRKILKSYHSQNLKILTKFLRRLMRAEQRISEFEDQLLWQAEFENRSLDRQETLEKLEKKIERLQQSVNTIELEKMLFDPES